MIFSLHSTCNLNFPLVNRNAINEHFRKIASDSGGKFNNLWASSSSTMIVIRRLLEGSIPDTITNSGGTRRTDAIIDRSFSSSGLWYVSRSAPFM